MVSAKVETATATPYWPRATGPSARARIGAVTTVASGAAAYSASSTGRGKADASEAPRGAVRAVGGRIRSVGIGGLLGLDGATVTGPGRPAAVIRSSGGEPSGTIDG